GKSQREIAEKIGVSQMYISRMERRILDKFRFYWFKES
ncbi:MAG: helix-turn-helix domain-containing protein, partial [Clostridiales bacterium]|nr:helix-turn-helix domain-containing protein [Clostridiales bacterium]